MPIKVAGKKGEFEIGKLVGETPDFRVYFCRNVAQPEIELLFKVVKDREKNNILDNEAFILRELADKIEEAEAARVRINGHDAYPLGYALGYPYVADSFIIESQGNRRATVLGYHVSSDDLGRWVPMEHITSRLKMRVDPKTAAWMMGKTLKLLQFPHEIGIELGNLAGSNLLVHFGEADSDDDERRSHFVSFFDFSQAALHDEEVPSEIVRKEIAKAARSVIKVLGGDFSVPSIPEDPQLPDARFARILFRFARGECSSARDAHREFYGLIRELWGISYHPFTTYLL